MPPLFMPPALAWTLGVLGAAALAKLVVKEWRRVNAELHPQPAASRSERDRLPKLKRDPRSGIYRPE